MISLSRDCTPVRRAWATGHSASLYRRPSSSRICNKLRTEMMLKHAAGDHSRQAFRAAVPKLDAKIVVEEHHGVVHVVQQLVLE